MFQHDSLILRQNTTYTVFSAPAFSFVRKVCGIPVFGVVRTGFRFCPQSLRYTGFRYRPRRLAVSSVHLQIKVPVPVLVPAWDFGIVRTGSRCRPQNLRYCPQKLSVSSAKFAVLSAKGSVPSTKFAVLSAKAFGVVRKASESLIIRDPQPWFTMCE